MARRGIDKEKVFAAADRLAARGEAVTVTRLREEVGNTGSYTTLSAHLKAWRAHTAGEDDPERLPDDVAGGVLQLVRKLWQGLARRVDRREEQHSRRMEARLDRLEHEVDGAAERLRALAERQQEQEQALTELYQRDTERAAAVARLQAELERLRVRLAMTDED